MTETPQSQFPPMHPVTRLARIIQQLRSAGELHANELEGMAAEVEAGGSDDLAAKLRAYRDVQREQAAMVILELVDIQRDMADGAQPEEVPPTGAEQAAEEERLRQPISRRELFDRVANPGEDEDQ